MWINFYRTYMTFLDTISWATQETPKILDAEVRCSIREKSDDSLDLLDLFIVVFVLL